MEVLAINNDAVENQESFNVTIQSDDRSVLFVSNQASILVIDDDGK